MGRLQHHRRRRLLGHQQLQRCLRHRRRRLLGHHRRRRLLGHQQLQRCLSSSSATTASTIWAIVVAIVVDDVAIVVELLCRRRAPPSWAGELLCRGAAPMHKLASRHLAVRRGAMGQPECWQSLLEPKFSHDAMGGQKLKILTRPWAPLRPGVGGSAGGRGGPGAPPLPCPPSGRRLRPADSGGTRFCAGPIGIPKDSQLRILRNSNGIQKNLEVLFRRFQPPEIVFGPWQRWKWIWDAGAGQGGRGDQRQEEDQQEEDQQEEDQLEEEEVWGQIFWFFSAGG